MRLGKGFSKKQPQEDGRLTPHGGIGERVPSLPPGHLIGSAGGLRNRGNENDAKRSRHERSD